MVFHQTRLLKNQNFPYSSILPSSLLLNIHFDRVFVPTVKTVQFLSLILSSHRSSDTVCSNAAVTVASDLALPISSGFKLMVSTRLQQLVRGMFWLAGITLLAGCSSIGGSVANSSGMGYYERGNYAAAAEEFQQALISNPSNPDYMANLAKVRMKTGDAFGSEQLYRQALSIAPSHQPTYHGLAELMMAQGRGQEAHAMISTWANSQPYNAEPQVELAWLYRQQGSPQDAGQALQRALEINPNNSVAMSNLGQLYEESGRPDQAVALYQQSLRVDWNQPDVHSRIAAAGQAAGPSSTMGATAMARGMHPYQVTGQRTAFAPASRGHQLAGMPMMPHQFAGPSAGPRSAMTMAGAQQGAVIPGNYLSSSMTAPPGGGWQMAGSPVMLNQPANPAFSATFPEMNSGMPSSDFMMTPANGSFPPTAGPGGFQIPSAPGPPTVASPTPDPSFSAVSPQQPPAGLPVSTVSLSAQMDSPLPAGTEPPVVEAF